MVAARYKFYQKADELFLSGLQYLGGGSQERNSGIAALSLALESRRHRKHIAHLLAGNAVYLLLENKQRAAAHELHNLRRLIKLIDVSNSTRDLSVDDRRTLLQSIDQKLSAGADKPPGLLLAESDLNAWGSRLSVGKTVLKPHNTD